MVRRWVEVVAGVVEAGDGSVCSMRTSVQQARGGVRGKEHRGMGCPDGIHTVAAMSCKVGLATLPW
jgi:hypothetical protein